jgi:hypothetical protein
MESWGEPSPTGQVKIKVIATERDSPFQTAAQALFRDSNSHLVTESLPLGPLDTVTLIRSAIRRELPTALLGGANG